MGLCFGGVAPLVGRRAVRGASHAMVWAAATHDRCWRAPQLRRHSNGVAPAGESLAASIAPHARRQLARGGAITRVPERAGAPCCRPVVGGGVWVCDGCW